MEDRKGEWQSRAPYEISYPHTVFFLSFLFPFLFSVAKRPMCCSIGLHSQGREAATDWVEPDNWNSYWCAKKGIEKKVFFPGYHVCIVLKGNRK